MRAPKPYRKQHGFGPTKHYTLIIQLVLFNIFILADFYFASLDFILFGLFYTYLRCPYPSRWYYSDHHPLQNKSFRKYYFYILAYQLANYRNKVIPMKDYFTNIPGGQNATSRKHVSSQVHVSGSGGIGEFKASHD